jgi:two-component system OmpR family sensor kinase
MSIFYSIYALKPLKTALNLLDEFLKDIIHDLNTPISSILLNLQILKNKKSDDAIKRIEFSTKNISSLYANLEMIIKDTPLNMEEVDIKNLISEKVTYYNFIYPHINFKTDIKIEQIKTSKNEFSRIVDNLISNACKYNKQDGNITIHVDEKILAVEDSGIGIKNVNRVFDRFYKETDRGIGLGLDIVQKLAHKLGYKIKIASTLNIGTKIEVTLK